MRSPLRSTKSSREISFARAVPEARTATNFKRMKLFGEFSEYRGNYYFGGPQRQHHHLDGPDHEKASRREGYRPVPTAQTTRQNGSVHCVSSQRSPRRRRCCRGSCTKFITHSCAEGAPGAAEGPANGGQRAAGTGGGRADFQQIVNRLPAATLSDFQKGEAIMVVSTQGTDSAGVTAITLLGGWSRFWQRRQPAMRAKR